MRLFCFGFGYVAKRLADALGDAAHVMGTSRSSSGDPRVVVWDKANIADSTHLLISIPPDEAGRDAALEWLAGRDLSHVQWIGYLSTTGVYGDWRGEWVDETSPCHPTEPRSIRRLQAEQAWQELGAHIFRLSGIYGPERNALNQLQAGTAKRIDAPNHVFGRIHVDDIVQVLLASMAKPEPRAVYNVSDDLPSESREVVEYAAELLGMEPPPLVALADAELSPMAQSFYAASRRVKNDKIKHELGVKLLYPTYREGLLALKLHC